MEAILRLELVLSILEARVKEFRNKQAPYEDKFGRGHYSGWAAATEAAIDLIRPIYEELKAEQPPEEPFNSLAEKEAAL